MTGKLNPVIDFKEIKSTVINTQLQLHTAANGVSKAEVDIVIIKDQSMSRDWDILRYWAIY